jgi:predicted MFS family arabinose efflux permease
MLHLLRSNRDLRLLFVAQVVSFMGDWFSYVAVIGSVDDATGSPLLVAMVLVAFSLPSFFASPFSGPLVDRFDRRRVLIVTSALQAVAALGLLGSTPTTVWPLFACQCLIAALAAVVKPAIDAGVPNLARNPDELRAANSLFGSTWGVMLALGAALGGLFSTTFGRDASFVANAVSFVIAMALFSMITQPMQEGRAAIRGRQTPLRDMREAVTFARRDRTVMALIASKATFGIGAGVVGQLPVLASQVFGWGDDGRGLLIGARGIGAGLGPILAARFTKGNVAKVLTVCGAASIAFSVCYVMAAWSPLLPIAALFVIVAHLGGGAQWTLSTYGLQLRTPDAIRGRVMAGDFAIVTLVLSLTAAAAGLLAEVLDVRWVMTIFAGTAGVAGAVYLLVTRSLRDDHAADATADDTATVPG